MCSKLICDVVVAIEYQDVVQCCTHMCMFVAAKALNAEHGYEVGHKMEGDGGVNRVWRGEN